MPIKQLVISAFLMFVTGDALSENETFQAACYRKLITVENRAIDKIGGLFPPKKFDDGLLYAFYYYAADEFVTMNCTSWPNGSVKTLSVVGGDIWEYKSELSASEAKDIEAREKKLRACMAYMNHSNRAECISKLSKK